MNKLLLIEDDNSLGYMLKEYLQMKDFQVDWAKDGEEGIKTFKSHNFDLCILDIMMPKKDGFTVAQEIKNLNPQMPIIFLTAKSMKVDKLKGFKIGADDYIIKPVEEEELIARIQAVLRRSGSLKIEKVEKFQIGQYEFNARNQSLCLEGTATHLTQKETLVLEMLCQDLGTLVSRDDILTRVWGENDYFKRRSMDVVISKLRKYLVKDTAISISNVHGRGYILTLN